MEEGKKVMGDLMKSEEAKEMMDLSKSLLSEFSTSDMVTSTINKVKTTWNEKGEELTEKGKELVEKGLDTAKKVSDESKKDKKKKKHTVYLFPLSHGDSLRVRVHGSPPP